MTGNQSQQLTLDEVHHVAKLARLKLNDEQAELYRTQLAKVLGYVAKLDELDVTNVEPLAHPTEMTNQLSEDVVGESMPLEGLLKNAPQMEGRFLATPKVLGDGGDA